MPTIVAVSDIGTPPVGGAPPCEIDAERDAPADRIFIGEVQRREPLVDDRGFASGHAVFVGQVAAALQRQPDRLEVTRIDGQHRDARRLLSLIERLAVDVQDAQEAALHRGIAGDGDVLDSRIRLQPLLELLVEGQSLFERRVLPLRQRQVHGQQLRRVDAEIEADTSSGSCGS